MKSRALSSRPTCAVCNKPVDEMREEEDPSFRRVTFIARCHGRTERVTLEEDAARSIKIMGFGFAFSSAPRQLPAGPSS